MSWHGCVHCAIRGVDREGLLCYLCAEEWGHRTAATCPSRKCYFWRMDRGGRRAFLNAPENEPDWKGYLDRPNGDPVLPLPLRPKPTKETTQ